MKKFLFFALMLIVLSGFAGFVMAETATITPTITATVTPTITVTAVVIATQVASKFGDIVKISETKFNMKAAASSGLLYAVYSQGNGNTAVARSLSIWDGAGNTVFARSWTVGQHLPHAIFEAITYKGAAPPAVSALPYTTSLTVKTDFTVMIIKK